ncbi:MAG: hypothetical protein AABX70_00230 [Nanoarchaeota archaeon]
MSLNGRTRTLVGLTALLTACASKPIGVHTDACNDSIAECMTSLTRQHAREPKPISTSTDCKDKFWESLEKLCSQTYLGVVTQDNMNKLTGSEMTIHVSHFNSQEIHVSVQVGNDYSRAWVLRNLGSHLDLRHVHVYEDGQEESRSQYGGSSALNGTESKQEFPADALTSRMIPGSDHHVWAIAIEPGRTLSYSLSNSSTKRYVEIRFDISRPL